MSYTKLFQRSVFLLTLTVGTAHANLIKNGDFEQAGVTVPDGGFVTVNSGSEAITDWNVGPTSVDLIKGAFGAIDGISIDMLGTPGPGFISQAFDVMAGTNYLLTFDLFRNTVPSATVRVGFTDALNSAIFKDFTSEGGNTPSAFSMVYRAPGSGPVTLSFASVGGDNLSGAVLDNVSVTDVPEPATIALMGLGLLGFAASRRNSVKNKNA